MLDRQPCLSLRKWWLPINIPLFALIEEFLFAHQNQSMMLVLFFHQMLLWSFMNLIIPVKLNEKLFCICVPYTNFTTYLSFLQCVCLCIYCTRQKTQYRHVLRWNITNHKHVPSLLNDILIWSFLQLPLWIFIPFSIFNCYNLQCCYCFSFPCALPHWRPSTSMCLGQCSLTTNMYQVLYTVVCSFIFLWKVFLSTFVSSVL